MQLENLYTNFGESSPEAQAAYVSEYRLKRAIDMEKTPTWPKPKKVSKTKNPPLTEEEKVLMTLMGLKKKDIFAMRKGDYNDA